MTVWGNGYPLYRIKCALGKCSSCITISRYARNDRVENEYPVHHTKNVWETRSSRIVIPSGAEGSFSLAVRGRVSDSEKRETPYREKVGAVLPVNGLAKEEGKRGRKRFLAALEMTVCGMNNQCKVKEKRKARFPYLHPERSRGIFFVGGKTASV